MLGIIIGVAGVIVILSVGAGAQSLIFNQVDSLGSNIIGITPGASDEDGPPASAMGVTVTTLKYSDLEKILDDPTLNDIVAGAGYVRGMATAQWQDRSLDLTYVGTSPGYVEVEGASLAAGRFFTDSEDKSLAAVAVIGQQVAEELFGSTDPLNQKIKLRRESFRVIGVLAERGATVFGNPDEQIFIPLQTAQKLLLNINYLNYLRFQVGDDQAVEPTIKQLEAVLRDYHDIDAVEPSDFSVRSQAQALDILRSVTDALTFFLAAIAGIALLVGGVGIMNIMLVSVTERTAEIGLRKAVGARPRALIYQFLIEAVVVTVLGGLIGVLLGALIAGLVSLVANYLGYYWEFIVSWQSILISLVISASVGIIFGIYPAIRAARLNPVEALHYE